MLLAQAGRSEEATAALRQGERLAMAIHADDVLAGIVHNQANVALMRHRHDEALALAERSVALHQSLGSGHGLAVALATLGQIFVQLGDLERAEQILTRTLEVRSPVQFHETTGAVFDTLAQIHLMRGSYERAGEYLRLASEAYGAYGTQTMRWYEWSLKVLGVKLAIAAAGATTKRVSDGRRARPGAGRAAGATPSRPTSPPAKRCSPPDGCDEAEQRLDACEGRLDPRGAPANWGEFLRIRGLVHEQSPRPSAAHHDFAQSANIFDLLGERYQAALSHLSLGRLSAEAGSPSAAERYLDLAESVFKTLGAQRDLTEVNAVRSAADATPRRGRRVMPADADEAIVRRLVDAAIFPELLARETATALSKSPRLDAVVVFVAVRRRRRARRRPPRDATAKSPRERWRTPRAGHSRARRPDLLLVEPLGTRPRRPAPLRDRRRRARSTDAAAARLPDVRGGRAPGIRAVRRARAPDARPSSSTTSGRSSRCCPDSSAPAPAMNRLADQIQRMQGHNLTVLITGESGTGKDLVARAIHVGSPRSAAMFLPYNCTTTTRELADSQLFGHRRGSFTGAVTDQQGLIRSAAGGTLFLDEIGDLPLDIQPKLLRFLEQGEIMPVGETRPQAVDVRVLAATNADLEQRVAEGKFREDLYYRLSVIRIHVPPLRERREEVPHLSTFFLRDACERLGKPDVHLSSATLDLFARYWWPGNVRQLRNEIQRAVAMSPPGGTIEPEHLSADLTAPERPRESGAAIAGPAPATSRPATWRPSSKPSSGTLIATTLDRTRGNISESARVLGLTRRGLYLKMRRLGLEAAVADI